MTITMCTTGCDRPAHNGYLCRECTAELVEALRDIPWLSRSLETAVGRRARFGTRVGGRSAETPLPIDWSASIMLGALRNTLSTWVRHLAAGDEPADTLQAMADWLRARIERIRNTMASAELHDEITACVAACRRQVDRPADRWYAGRCSCGEELYTAAGAELMRCRECGAERRVDQWREYLLKQARDYLLTASEAADALGAWGQPVTPGRIWQWASRGRIAKKGTDHRGRPTYRLGDIIDRLTEDAQRANGKKAS